MVDTDSGIVLVPVEDGLGEGEVHVEEESEEDVPKLKLAPNVVSPSQEQIEEHRTAHCPYRSWCKQCVMGRGIGQPHAKPTQESTVPIVGMDSFYITKEGVRRRKQLAKELLKASGEDLERDSAAATEAISKARNDGEVVKCLLVRCLQSKNVFAHVVPQKGDDEYHYCAKMVVADVEWLGRTRIIVKMDNERAIVALKHRVAKILKEWKAMEIVQTERPAAYESQSNGGIEVGIKIVRGMCRTLELCLEARLGKYISTNHALTPWLLQHTCTILNAKSRGRHGLTCWERVKGRL